jgi:hypothetical protein
MINEGNKEDQYLEKKGESTKTTAMRKASSRRGRFSSGDTHQGSERENITWARPGTRSHADSLDRQRKSAHRSERGRKKPQAGSSPEDRRWAEFSGDKPEGKYEKLQKAKKKGERTNIEAQKQGLVRKGERRRQLRTQAVDAIRKAMGGGYVSEAKVEKDLSPTEKEDVRNKRAYGSTSSRDRATGIRRTFHAAERGVKKEIPTGNEKSEISGRFNKTGAELRREIRALKGRKSGRDFSKRVRQELEAKRYINRQNSDFAAKNAENKIVKLHREQKTFSEFMIEAYLIVERPYQIYGPDPHGSSDSEPKPLGKPYKNKKRAKTRADKLDQEIGGYRHFVRKVDDEEKNVKESSGMTPENKSTWERLVSQHGEQPFTNPRKSKTKSASRREEESTSPPKRKRRKLDFEVREDFVPLTPDKEEGVKKRVGELARDIQLQGARMKELKKKPLGRFRPKVKKEKEEIVKSARKKAKQVRSASDALIDASTSRSAKIQKRIEDLKGEL